MIANWIYRNSERHPKNSLSGENIWYGEQALEGEELHNQTTQHCTKYHLLESEYGRVLFERDLAQRNLKFASYRLGDKLQKERGKDTDGMEMSPFSFLAFIFIAKASFSYE